MDICDQGFCWLCSMPEPCCSCEFSDSPWSTSTSQASFGASDDGREKPAGFVVGRLSFDMFGANTWFLGDASENQNPGLETDDMIQPASGSHPLEPYATSTPTNSNNDSDTYTERWESPDATLPPNSSSPVDIGYGSPLFSTELAEPMSRGDVTVGRHTLFDLPNDGGQWRIKAPSHGPTYITTPADYHPSRSPTPKFQIQEVPSMDAQGPLDKRLCAINDRLVLASNISVDTQDICAATTQPFTEQTNHSKKRVDIAPVSARGSIVPASLERAGLSGPTLLDLAILMEIERTTASSHGTENDRPDNATTMNSKTDKTYAPRISPRKGPIISTSSLGQPTPDRGLKRRRTSVDGPLESKKVKLDRHVSHSSCASESSVESKYPATEPASIRRARSLRSELSACSEVSTDSLFYPSPLSSPAFRSSPVKEYPPTVPSTPIPNSVEYAKSKANPMVRTIAVHRGRSLNIPAIPPVPIIAPPPHIVPTSIRCAEDQAIDRIKALLLRERSERERDGLHVHDDKRTAELKAVCATSPAFPRRDSASTSDSSDARGQWEDETVVDSQESQDPPRSVKIITGSRRLVNREAWSNAFGVTNDFRKEITGWMLKKLPKKLLPRENSSRHDRRLGIDLYDQLTTSRQTRFHAAQMFHRYFLLPDKAQFWGELCKPERESCVLPGWRESIWDLAVASMALSVKLHRDCLPPLGPVYAADFLRLAPHSMTHESFELAQRDIMYSLGFFLGSCTPQDVLDELWNALPTLRRATGPIRDGWMVVQGVTWDKLFQSLLEPDMLQFPVTLLTAAALVEGLILALARHYKTETEANVCKCKPLLKTSSLESVPDDTESTLWQVHLYEANKRVEGVILDVKDVLQLSDMELDECRMWLSYVDHE